MENKLKKQIKQIKRKIELLKKDLDSLIGECEHNELDISPYGSAKCLICGEHFSWYCPTSPDLECDYVQDNGDYDEDCCRYCGHPEERK